MSVRLFCVEGNYDAVEAALKELKGIESVASLPNKKGRTVFAKFANDDAASAALEVLKTNTNVVIPAPKGEKKDVPTPAPSAKKSKNAAAEFFRYDPYSGPRPVVSAASSGAAATAGPSADQEGQERGPQRGRGRGGQQRGRGGRGGRGGNFQQRPRIPMIQGHVAVLDNVPVNATNDQIARSFDGCGGAIYDINRLENMAMIYFSTSEAVQEAIVKMNGQKLGSKIVTVSSGGTVRVPAPMAPPPSGPHQQQQQQRQQLPQ